MSLKKAKLLFEKVIVNLKKYAWIILLGLGALLGLILYITSRKDSLLVLSMDLLRDKNDQSIQEIETLNHIYNTEVQEKELRRKEYAQEVERINKEFEAKKVKLDSKAKQRLKEMIDDGYNNPEELSRRMAAEFGLEHG